MARPIGFFSELRHGHRDGPSIGQARRMARPPEEAVAIARYLRNSSVLLATSQHAGDVLDHSNDDIGPISLHTDGTYYWPEDLAHYVESHGLAVPADLAERAVTGPPVELSLDELMEVVRLVRGDR